MIEKSTRTFVGILTVLLLVITPLSVLSHQALGASSTGVMVALYTYPDNTWNTVAQAKSAHPSVPVVAIINPNNGPGSSRDPNYVSGIQKLHSAGVVVLGYDATGYASRSASEVKAVMNTWKSLYNIDGIFFDEMSNVGGDENYYSNLSSYAKSLGYTLTVGNPGTNTIPSYIGTVDNLMIYENPGLPALSAIAGWHTNYDKSNFSMIAFGIGSLSQSFITSASNYVGYIYISNDNLPNPYDSVPSYFGAEVAELDTGSSSTAPQAPTGLAATTISQSQIHLSWTAANNGGSPITGYKIGRSTDGGSTWTPTVSNTGSTATTYSDTGLDPSTTYTYRVSAINGIGTSSPSSTASATTSSNTAKVSQPPTNLSATTISQSQIDLSWTVPSNNGGSPITGYKIGRSTDGGSTWTPTVSNTGSTATTYSDTGLDPSTTYTYRVSAINGIGTSSPSSTVSATTSPISTGTVSLTVKSVDLAGNAITGLWTTIQSGYTILKTGYTPLTFTVNANSQYTVSVTNYQNNVFDHWGNGSTNATKTITPTQDTTVIAHYSTGSTHVSLTVKSVDLAGNAITGLWTTIQSGSTILKTGYTPLTFTVNANSQYTVSVANYQNNVFDHWGNGSTDATKIITPTQDTTVMAYYNQ